MIVALVGDFGTGKTSLIKRKFLKAKKQKLVYALIGKDFGNTPTIRNPKIFIERAAKMNNTLFVIDEAKTFLPRKEPDPVKFEFGRKMYEWFLNARKCNNFILIIFHSFHDLPVWLVQYTDYILRFRTNDLIQYQVNRFSSFLPVVKSLNENKEIPNFEYDEIRLR